jgi:hypothetical protein
MSLTATDLRAALRAELLAELPAITWVKDWWRKEQVTELPRGAVATPSRRYNRVSTASTDVEVDLLVIVKRAGDADLEDDLDDDGRRIAARANTYLDTVSDDFDLTEIRSGISQQGDKPIGELTMFFRVVLRGN